MTSSPVDLVSAPPPQWSDLSATGRRVLLDLLVHGPRSRIRIAERLGLSRASLTRVARELVDSGVVLQGDTLPSATRGRPAEELQLRPQAAHFIGVKITAERIYVVATDLAAEVVDEISAPLISPDVETVVDEISAAAASLIRRFGNVSAVGVGLAADVLRRDGEAVVKASPLLGWSEPIPLPRLLEERIGLPITVTNDVHALTAAHHWFGSGVNHRSLVVYGVGAGIGSGAVIDDELVEGANGRSGRVGHTRVGGTGRVCANGHTDCVHSFVSMPAIELNAGVAPGEYPLAVARARAGGVREAEAFSSAAYALGAVVAESVNLFDPELVSLMGEGLDMLDLAPGAYRDGLVAHLEQVPIESVRTERPPFTFGLYARGASATAIRDLLSE
ncbi:ROK family transcriptional regulator [Microbacterium hatanonis]|uniref:ROK family transcriptional regulator n=1 Tax=Microbacterium hatanonis TaxID=404366 RepID=UPI00164F136C|nr:ROK family transcriptional regulator [Microbacterium hatanonis]